MIDPTVPPPLPSESPKDGIVRGLVIGVVAHGFQIVIVPLILFGMTAFTANKNMGSNTLLIALSVGVTQLVYMVPLILWARKQGLKDTAQGIMIVAAVTFLINGACEAQFFSSSLSG